MASEKHLGECRQTRRQCLERLVARLRAIGWAGNDRGQAAVEYIVVTGVLLAAMLIMALFTETFKEWGERLLELIASDYP